MHVKKKNITFSLIKEMVLVEGIQLATRKLGKLLFFWNVLFSWCIIGVVLDF